MTGVTVVVTDGTEYTVPGGTSWTAEPTVTGEIFTRVLDASGNDAAAFAGVEAVYFTRQVSRA